MKLNNDYIDYLDEHIKDNFYEKKMLNQENEYCSISDLTKRFIEIDKEYDSPDWNLRQILTNIRMTEYCTIEELKGEINGKDK